MYWFTNPNMSMYLLLNDNTALLCLHARTIVDITHEPQGVNQYNKCAFYKQNPWISATTINTMIVLKKINDKKAKVKK